MKDPQDLHHFAADSVRNQVARSSHHELARPRHTTRASDGGIVGESSDGRQNPLDNYSRGSRIVGADERGFLLEVGERPPQPADARLLTSPLTRKGGHFLLGCEVPGVGFLERLADFADLPLVDVDEPANGFRGEKRPAALRSLC